jgi:hypothetical protein
VVYRRRYRTFGLIVSLFLLLGLDATVVAPGAEAATAYSPPSGSWSRFQSDLNAAEGLATGSGVTIALLSTGVDTTVTGLSGKVTNGPDYIFAPQASETDMFGTVMAGFLLGEPGITPGVAPDARILSLRTEPDSSEPGAQAWAESTNGQQQQAEAKGIRYAAGHGAQVIVLDYATLDSPDPLLVSAVSYALSKNVVLVAPAFSADNSQSWRYLYPEGLPGVIGVNPVMLPGGTPPGASVSGQTQSDNSVLISAPGDSVVASADFDVQNFGTAIGFVAGTVALIKERFPGLSPALVARALAMSARYHPSGGYSTTYGFGVLDPNDAILDAGALAKLTPAAPAGAAGVVAAGAHFGPPPGVISALPPVGTVAYLYWGLIAVGAVLFVTGVVLLVRRRRPSAPPRQGGAPQFVPAYTGQPSPGQPFPGQPYPGQQYPGARPYPSQDQPPQPYQPLPFREPAYPTRPNWSPLPPSSPAPASPVPPSHAVPPSAPPASGPLSPAPAPWEPPAASPGYPPWEQAPGSPAHAPWEPAPPPPDSPESGKGWFDPR